MYKLLFFIHDLSGGGAEKVMVNLVNSLDSLKFEITVLTLFDQGINKKFLGENIKYKSIFNKAFRGNSYILKFFPAKLLYKIFVHDTYDIVISYMQGTTTRIISGAPKNIVKINWVHTTFYKKKFLKAYWSFNHLIQTYNSYDKTIFVSKYAQDTFSIATGITNAETLYNVIDTNTIKSLAQKGQPNFNKEKINLITIGRLIESKGYRRLIEIINNIIKNNDDIHLYILGEGNQRKELEEKIIESNLTGYITLLGFHENPYPYLQNSDLFICSSFYEGYSTAITEALILGVPVISTEVSGVREQLGFNSEFGIIVDNDGESLEEGLKYILESPKHLQYLKQKAIERGEKFNTKKTVSEVEELIIRLIAAKRG